MGAFFTFGINVDKVGPTFLKESSNLSALTFVSGGMIFIYLKFSLTCGFFVPIDDSFYDLPRLFSIIPVSNNQVIKILLFNHFKQMLQFALIFFITVFIEGRSKFLYFKYSLYLCLIEFFSASDNQGFLLLYLFFVLILGKCLLNRSSKWSGNRS